MKTPPPRLENIRFFYPGLEDEPAAKETLGGKGHSLALMSRAGFPVPPGFTIRTDCCRAYYEANRSWPEGLDAEVRRAMEWLEATTERTFGRGARPLLVAVRSGAAVSMPGMMDTLLNVGRSDDPWSELTRAISAVFDSWNSERAVHYRAKNTIRDLAGSAVTVQAMFPSQRSGVLFTQDPNRPDDERIVIEAAVGLGEQVVQGSVDPDVFRVHRGNVSSVEKRLVGSEACLTEAEIRELAELGLKVERHYGVPVDLEWGLAEGGIVLLQSRPIRGLEVAREVEPARRDEITRLKSFVNGGERTWATHNLAETLPAPTPLTWDIIGRGFMADGFIRLYRSLGFTPSARVEREGFLELIAGRIYADLDRAAELFFDRFPLEYDLSSGKRASELLLDRPTRFNVERAGLGFLARLPATLVRMIRAGRVLRHAARDGFDNLNQRVLPEFAAYVERTRAEPLRTLPDAGILTSLRERERIGLNRFGADLLRPGYLAGYFHGRLAETLEQVLGPNEGRALTAQLLAGLDGDTTVESNLALARVAAGRNELQSYLSEFGHRAVNELELSEPRWSEDASYLESRIRQLRTSGASVPLERHEAQKRERQLAEDGLGDTLRAAGASSLEEEIRSDLGGAQRYLPCRESCKHAFMMSVALVRDAIEILAERWDLGRDIYYLRREELDEFESDPDRFRSAIDSRKIRWKALQRLPMPDVLRSSALEAIGKEEELASAVDGTYEGVGVAAGIGTGPARILTSPSEAGDLGTGYVLVCPTTDPSWTPLFVHAAGLIVERGGMLSHGAIVARDFGIPAVVLPQATRLLREGAVVRVDGNRGRVERGKE